MQMFEVSLVLSNWDRLQAPKALPCGGILETKAGGQDDWGT